MSQIPTLVLCRPTYIDGAAGRSRIRFSARIYSRCRGHGSAGDDQGRKRGSVFSQLAGIRFFCAEDGSGAETQR